MTMNMVIVIVMVMNIYITSENEQFLKSIKDEQSMSGIVNSLLNDYRASRGAVPEKKPAPKATGTPKTEPQFHRIITLPKTETKPKNEDEYDPLDDMVYERRVNTVWDTSTGEVAAVTQKEVNELIRRGQVK